MAEGRRHGRRTRQKAKGTRQKAKGTANQPSRHAVRLPLRNPRGRVWRQTFRLAVRISNDASRGRRLVGPGPEPADAAPRARVGQPRRCRFDRPSRLDPRDRGRRHAAAHRSPAAGRARGAVANERQSIRPGVSAASGGACLFCFPGADGSVPARCDPPRRQSAAVPALAVCSLVARLRGARLVIDWQDRLIGGRPRSSESRIASYARLREVSGAGPVCPRPHRRYASARRLAPARIRRSGHGR